MTKPPAAARPPPLRSLDRLVGTWAVSGSGISGTVRYEWMDGGGEILEYTYDLTGDTLTIWFGDSTSPAKFVGVFNADDSTNTGAWEWPGGGYESTMARIS